MGEVRVEIELPSEETGQHAGHAQQSTKKDLSALFAFLQVIIEGSNNVQVRLKYDRDF